MVRNITKTLIILTAVFLLNSLFAVRAEAASCAAVPISGNYTVSASCTFANTVDGVDAGSGTVNTAVLTVNSGQTLTVNSGQTIGFGSITNNGTILLNTNKTAVLQKGPIWMTDQDADGYVATTTQYAQSSAPANGRRRNLLTNITTADCLDTDATKYQNLTGYNDLDGDTYTSGTTQICSGASLPAYNQTTSPYRSAASGTADCYDVNSTGGTNAHPGQSGWFTANRGDGSNDYNCDGVGLSLGNLGALAWTSSACNALAARSTSTYWILSGSGGTCPANLTKTSSSTGYDKYITTVSCGGITYYGAVGGGTLYYYCINNSGVTRYN